MRIDCECQRLFPLEIPVMHTPAVTCSALVISQRGILDPKLVIPYVSGFE
jgi:hypothetical protein